MQGEPRSGGWRATPSSAPSRLAKPGRIELQVLAVLGVLLSDVSSFQLWLCKLRSYNKHTRKPISQTYVGAFCDPHGLVLHMDILYLSFCERFLFSWGHFTIRKAQRYKSLGLVLVPAKVSFFLCQGLGVESTTVEFASQEGYTTWESFRYVVLCVDMVSEPYLGITC